ncbi:MAG: D-glycero-alpha-D-manno-heptose-1,7-bisphosphate 7-phosphatase [Bacillota bacterium]
MKSEDSTQALSYDVVTMKSWAQLIADTVRMGGVLIFIKDGAPENFQEWLRPLTSTFEFHIPVSQRSVNDLAIRKFQTRPHDLIFFFDGQESALQKLDPILQGQRVWLAEKAQDSHNVDYIWGQVTLKSWETFWQSLQPQFDSLLENWSAESEEISPCLFLDRDDVVVRNVPYNKDATKVELLPGAVELIKRAHAKGYWVALVTNQSGLGRGRITWAEYQTVHQRMLELLAEQGAWIDECVWSAFIENESVPEGRVLAGLRKPRAGMFQIVREKLKVKMSASMMIGDSATDLIAAHSAGIRRCYLFQSEKYSKELETLQKFQQNHSEFQFSTVADFSKILP